MLTDLLLSCIIKTTKEVRENKRKEVNKMMNLFRRNRKAETIEIKITWMDGEVEYTTATSAGIASLMADPCIDKVERI